MTIKSIIDVEVDPDGNFERFQELFDKYQQQLGKTPNAWKNASKESAAMATQFERMTAALMAQGQVNREQAEARKAQEKHLTVSQRLWTDISKASGTVSKNVVTATKALLSWTGIIGGVTGLLGLGGLYGLDRMAERVSDQRRSSLGLGLTIGQQKSFETNLGRFVNPGAFLSGISAATADPSKQGGLYALGVNPNGSPADVAIAVLKAVRARALATPANQIGLLESQYGLGDIGLGLEDVRRLRSVSGNEFNAQIANFRGNQGDLGIDDATARRWQDFTTQMDRAGQSIFKTFVIGLGPLADPLSHLSDSVVKLIKDAFPADGNGPIKKGIDQLGKWIDDFADTLKSGDFQEKVKQFVSDTGQLADSIRSFTNAVEHPGDTAVSLLKAAPGQFLNVVDANAGAMQKALDWLRGKFSPASSIVSMNESKYGLPSGLEDYVWGKESSRNTTAPNSSAGAIGPFQIMQAMAGGYNVSDFTQGAERAAQILITELRHYGGDVQKALVAYNRGDPAADKLFATDPNWRKTDKYSKDWSGPMKIEINNNTGGSAVASLAQQTP